MLYTGNIQKKKRDFLVIILNFRRVMFNAKQTYSIYADLLKKLLYMNEDISNRRFISLSQIHM
jgi:hypothetical protein